jgi:putative membrane protein
MPDSELNSQSTASGETQTRPTNNQWMALSPIAVLYFASSTIKHAVGNIVYLAPALIAGYSTLKENPFLGVVAMIAFLSIPLGYGALSFIFYRFRLNQGSVEIRSGVLSKKHLNLPFERIQNVKFEQPFYYRPFDYCCVELDTAGSSGKEAQIVAMPTQDAEHLKEQILNYAIETKDEEITEERTTGNTDTSHTVPNSPQETVLNRRSISDLVIHGLTSNRVWILAAALAPFYDNLSSYVASWMTNLGIDIESLVDQSTTPLWQIAIFILAATFLVILTMTLLSIIGAIIMFYGFTLSKTKERYIQRSGLLTKHEVSMKVSRIQVAIRKQDWLDSLLGRMNLIFEQKSQLAQKGELSAAQSKLTIPSIKLNECQQIIDDAMPDNKMAGLTYTPINKRFISRTVLFQLMPIFFPIMAVLLYEQQFNIVGLSLVALCLAIVLVILRWKRWGYHIDEQFLYVRKGLLGVSYYCIPVFKVQQTRYKQSLFMRRTKLAHVEFVLASGVVNVPFINQSEALHLVDSTLYQVESTQRSWM